MVDPKLSARDSVRWTDAENLGLDHVTLVEEDLSWIAEVRWATFWNVKFPGGFFHGCRIWSTWMCAGVRERTRTRLAFNSSPSYGLPHVTQIPPLGALLNLDRAEIGSMKGLEGISGLLEAPALTELLFSQKVGVTQADAASIATHDTIKKFAWFAEDVPERVYVPFVERVGKPSAGFDWWERNTRQPQ